MTFLVENTRPARASTWPSWRSCTARQLRQLPVRLQGLSQHVLGIVRFQDCHAGQWRGCRWVGRGQARSKPVVDDEISAADKPQQVTIVFRNPVARPGTPEAHAQGCLCRSESNMHAGFLAAERKFEDEVIVVIHKDCPLHKILRKPMDDVLGDQ